MSSEQIGYRFDALYNHFSNLNLMRANKEEQKAYKEYIDQLKENKNCFFSYIINYNICVNIYV